MFYNCFSLFAFYLFSVCFINLFNFYFQNLKERRRGCNKQNHFFTGNEMLDAILFSFLLISTTSKDQAFSLLNFFYCCLLELISIYACKVEKAFKCLEIKKWKVQIELYYDYQIKEWNNSYRCYTYVTWDGINHAFKIKKYEKV